MPTDTIPDRGFLLAEEEALKAKLSEIYVTDPNTANKRRRVHVRWGYPMAEVNRQYPFITIEFIDGVRRGPRPLGADGGDRLLAERVRHLRRVRRGHRIDHGPAESAAPRP